MGFSTSTLLNVTHLLLYSVSRKYYDLFLSENWSTSAIIIQSWMAPSTVYHTEFSRDQPHVKKKKKKKKKG